MTTLTHKTIKAAATASAKGEFAAIAATYDVDRVQERIVPGAFGMTIAKWQESTKMIPLHWDHSGSAEDIIGYVNPASMRETDEGLYVEGRLDLKSSAVAREAWRSMKNNAVALSFGYLAKTRKADKGVTEIVEVDLFEISIVPGPANPATRLLALKNFGNGAAVEQTSSEQSAVEEGSDEEPEKAKSAPQDPLRKRTQDALMALATDGVPPRVPVVPEPIPEPIDELDLRRRSDRMRLDIASG